MRDNKHRKKLQILPHPRVFPQKDKYLKLFSFYDLEIIA